MNKIIEKIASVGTALLLVFAGVLPVVNANAESHGSGEYELTLSVDSNQEWVASFTIDGINWSAGDTYKSATGNYFISMELHIPNESVGQSTGIRTGGDKNLTMALAGAEEDWGGTHRKFVFTGNFIAANTHDHLALNPYSEGDENNNPEQEPQGDTEAVVILRGDEEAIRETSFAINEGRFFQIMPEDMVENEDYGRVNYWYDYDEDADNGQVRITLNTLWHMRFVGNVIINGTPYSVANYINYDDQMSFLDHYGGQTIGFTISGVAKADTYDITVDVDRSETTYIGNFLWTADPAQKYERDPDGNIIYDGNGDPVPGRDYVGNSSLALMAIEYTLGDTTYTCSIETGTCSWWTVGDQEHATECDLTDEDCGIPHVEFSSREDTDYDDGSLVVPAGARVTIQITPDYGYQVLDVNMSELAVSDDGVGVFTFTVPDGAAYFVADVVPMEDVVATNTESINNGSIDLGDNQTTLTSGTAKLEVNDVDLTDEDIEGFEDAAEDYNISTYLDISLYNITCKGAATCEGTTADSWVNQIHTLNEAATITLQLEDGVDGNEVVIVHQKQDGTYEVIPTTYDPLTNTIAFTTSSFSNYAIASRTAALSAPDTGVMTKVSKNAGGSVEIGAIAVLTFAIFAIVAFVAKRNA